ncbi:MAG: CHAD domain-containing protein [Bacteroidales bacterium]|nr:CHAD domain-containing protein [Bacteroidales bacterium]
METTQFIQHFDRRVASFYYYFGKTKESHEIEDIHQLRVSIKKQRVIWSLVQKISEGKWKEKAQDGLIGDLYWKSGKVRETQINLKLTEQFYHAVLSAYFKHQLNKQKQYNVALSRGMLVYDLNMYENLNTQLRQQMDEISDETVIKESGVLILKNAAKIRSSAKCDLHDVRKRLKAVQELIGIQRNLNNNGLVELNYQVKSLNVLLGEWHDYCVFDDSLKKFLKRSSGKENKRHIRNVINYVDCLQEARRKILRKQLKTEISRFPLNQIKDFL